MKKLVSFMLLLTAVHFTSAEELEKSEEGGYSGITTNKYKHYIGICTGVTYYYGILYKRWFKDDVFALQFHLFPLLYKTQYYGENEPYTRAIVKFGTTFFKTLNSYEYGRLLYYINGTIHYDSDRDYRYNYNEQTSEYVKTEAISIGGALGPGIEFYVWRLAFDILLGISGEFNTKTSEYRVVPGAETAIHFRF